MNIFSYTDPVEFLESEFARLKQKNPDFSVRKWAAQMQMDSADPLMNGLTRKKKLSLSVIEPICKFLQLSTSEAKFFETLILYTRAISETEKKLYLSMIFEQKSLAGENVAFVEQDSIFSHWIHMAILSMSKLKGVHCTPENMVALLKNEVSLEKMEEAVERLLRLGLIQYDASGSLRKSFEHTTTKSDVTRKEVQMYYEQVGDLAREAINLPVEEREFQCFSLAVKSSEINLFKEAVRQFRFKVAAITPEGEGDQVYQFNIQFFPLTHQMANKKKPLSPNHEVTT